MTGYIYYDEPYGAIKSVSLRRLEDDIPFIEVTDEEATAFILGTRGIGQWTVGEDQNLISVSSLHTSLVWRQGWETVPFGVGKIGVTIRTSPTSRYAEISLTSPARMVVSSSVTDRFRFVLTRRADPDSILASLSVPIADLDRDRMMVVHLPETPHAFDIQTLAFDDVAYRHEIVDVISPVIPLPKGRFEDVVPMQRRLPTGSCLAAYVCDDELRVRVIAGGGPRYDRGRDHVHVAVTKRNNPDHILFHFLVSVEKLEAGDFMIDCPYEYSQIDLFTDLMYRDAFFSEHPWIIP